MTVGRREDIALPAQSGFEGFPGQEGGSRQGGSRKAGAGKSGHVPPAAVARQAERASTCASASARGGTEVGVARARDLKNRKALPDATIKRMASYFARHNVDKRGRKWGDEDDPSAGYVAWLLWVETPVATGRPGSRTKMDD